MKMYSKPTTEIMSVQTERMMEGQGQSPTVYQNEMNDIDLD